LDEDIPIWPGTTGFTRDTIFTVDPDGFLLEAYHHGDNNGTHVDSPGHFVEGAATIEEIAADTLVAPLAVIDVQDKVAGNADYVLTRQDVLDWEAENGEIAPGTFVVLNTGWHKRWDTPGEYNNLDDADVQHFPGFGEESSRLLIERDVVGVGLDTLSLDHGASQDFIAHRVLLGANLYGVENLTNLDGLPTTGAYISVGVIPVRGAAQAQARVLVFKDGAATVAINRDDALAHSHDGFCGCCACGGLS